MSRLVTSSTLRMMSKVTWSKSRTHDDLTIEEALFNNMESVIETFKSVSCWSRSGKGQLILVTVHKDYDGELYSIFLREKTLHDSRL